MHILQNICNYVLVWGIIAAPLLLENFKSLFIWRLFLNIYIIQTIICI